MNKKTFWIKFKHLIFTPVLTVFLEKRLSSIIVVSFTFLQVLAGLFGLTFWGCPFYRVTKIPCPGCGLSLGVEHILRGNINYSLEIHAFSPFILIAFLIILFSLILRDNPREKFIRFIENFEKKTGLGMILLLMMIIYWILRLITQGLHFKSNWIY